ncbi:MAG TPA: phosphoglucomutase (alpha-D-glucose-1,6-bisphosphate-dependent) [Candidatus Paceibacterota bacterium]|nr:phosphoglucomutase (alpha-D-glucose-1,6-bisphosphate-dependent) [Verrucomicrobiota bacterium]HRY50353.1 phosphoglucomutase (alpha-D-glucose-1,6-bisphosphate-dependent) [Candidatus Paceibacterota bacterium]HSA00656.1 phosphoglucomutase (alpha-D-glucose-1,6-bisphosphate-dependent) [Candidatus Paceibacterota bacterium]
MIHPSAGKPVSAESLIDVNQIERDYYEGRPDVSDPHQLVSFGTSGHRGKSGDATFTEAHILAIVQAVCEYRRAENITGPLLLGKDTHALSGPAERTALEVLAANGVEILLQKGNGFTPTPVVSRAILVWNSSGKPNAADGLVITPSHNPPTDGGIKYNPPHGGPADTDVTSWIQERANALLRAGNREVRRIPYERVLKAETTHEEDFIGPYVDDLASVINMEAIRGSGLRIGVDPLGGSSLPYWEPIAERYGLNLTVVNPRVAPTFDFMTLDHDGKIRMDCSSPWAMAGLVKLQHDFDIAFGNDPDADRHGIVTPTHGLMDPNHYLATAIHFLHTHRRQWPLSAAAGKTVVSSAVIDRVVQSIGRRLAEVPVGFKWFAPGLHKGTFCFGGEESAGASFLRKDGTVWTTDKDGLILGLLAAEITAESGCNPSEYFDHLAALLGRPYYRRIDAKTTPEQKRAFKEVTAQTVTLEELAGDRVVAKLTRDPENGASIGGIKVVTERGWFAARPSGTENIVKIYAESMRSAEHLESIIREARQEIGRIVGSREFAAGEPAEG